MRTQIARMYGFSARLHGLSHAPAPLPTTISSVGCGSINCIGIAFFVKNLCSSELHFGRFYPHGGVNAMLLSRMGLVLILIRNLVSIDSSEMFFKREGVPQFVVRYPMHLELEPSSLAAALR